VRVAAHGSGRIPFEPLRDPVLDGHPGDARKGVRRFVIKSADWVLDLGREGGTGGGQLLAVGTPEQVAEVKESHTGRYLQHVLTKSRKHRVNRRPDTAAPAA